MPEPFYFGLIFIGGAAFSLLISGVIVGVAKNRVPTSPAADAQFFAGVRRGVLAMWLCAVVTVVLGVLILVVIADGRGSTPVSAGALTAAFAVALVAVSFTAATSIVVRRAVPKA